MKTRICFLAFAIGCLAYSSKGLAGSQLISVTDRKDHVYDQAQGVLYISTSSGEIERYDTSSGQLLTPWNVGVNLLGIDITPDGQSLYVAEGQTGATSGVVRKVSTSNGAVSNIFYNLTSGEAGAFDIKIGNSGKGLVTTQFAGSGWVPLRELVTATDTLTIRADAPGSGFSEVRQNTQINRGGDRSLMFMTESNISNGPILTYDSESDSFPSNTTTGSSLSSAQSTVNRNGQLIAIEAGGGLSILNPSLSTAQILGAFDAGIVFSPKFDLLYAASSSSDEIAVLETATWSEVNRFAIGENVGTSSSMDDGVMSMSDDGLKLFMSTNQGVRVFDVPEPSTLPLLALGGLFLRRRRQRMSQAAAHRY